MQNGKEVSAPTEALLKDFAVDRVATIIIQEVDKGKQGKKEPVIKQEPQESKEEPVVEQAPKEETIEDLQRKMRTRLVLS